MLAEQSEHPQHRYIPVDVANELIKLIATSQSLDSLLVLPIFVETVRSITEMTAFLVERSGSAQLTLRFPKLWKMTSVLSEEFSRGE